MTRDVPQPIPERLPETVGAACRLVLTTGDPRA